MKANLGKLRALWSLLIACALIAAPAIGQKPGPSIPPNDPGKPSADKPKRSDRTIRVDVDLVLVNVTVTDPFNRLVTGLEQENFRAT